MELQLSNNIENNKKKHPIIINFGLEQEINNNNNNNNNINA